MIRDESNDETSRNLFQRFGWPILIFASVGVWMFGPMISGQTVAGFRDSSYLYYPLFKWIDTQLAAGIVPWWDPNSNLGIPLVGDGSSSIFYPGKLVFFFRFLSFPSRYGLFLAMHFPLAAAGTYWLARLLKANSSGAALAAVSYSFSGSVLFQVNNAIYLVSAAWLPLALGCVWQLARTQNIRWALGGGMCCAMMILGGDPQMVYHVGLIAVATTLGSFYRRRQTHRLADIQQRGQCFWIVQSAFGLLILIVATVLLSAIQLWPTYQWAKFSERTNSVEMVNVWQLFDQIGQDPVSNRDPLIRRNTPNDDLSVMRSILAEQFNQLVAPLQAGTHREFAFQFSQPPWSVAELFWPNASGRLYPVYQRWTDQLPGADRVWVPSIYAGLLTIWLAIGGFRLWGRRRQRVWLSRIAAFFALGSLGWYGAVWLANEVSPAAQGVTGMGPQVGGVYWGMVMFLPKYFAFRYPAKLFVIANLCLCVLAGIQINRQRFGLLRIETMGFATLTLAVTVGLSFVLPSAGDNQPVCDVLFGPFDRSGCQLDLMFSAFHSLLILSAAIVCFKVIRQRMNKIRMYTMGLVALTALDCGVANRWMLAEVPAASFESDTRVMKDLREQLQAAQHATDRLVSVCRYPSDLSEPLKWRRVSSDDRLTEILIWQRETLFPKHHLEYNVRLMGDFSSIWPTEYQWLNEQVESDRLSGEKRGPVISDLRIFADDGDEYRIRVVDFQRRLGQRLLPDFRTQSFEFGAFISACGWLLLAIYGGWIWAGNRSGKIAKQA